MNRTLMLAAAAVLALTVGGSPGLAADAVPQQLAQTAPAAPGDALASRKTPQGMELGRADAPVTIIEFSSLTCPHCATFHAETLPKIKKEWIETGKAKLVYRDFPLDGVALGAAMLAHCAGPERYFVFLETLFQTQKTWATADNPAQRLKNIALLGGLPEQKFDACLEDQALMQEIQVRQKASQQEFDIKSTPTFVINGTKITGAQPYEEFAKALAKAMP